MPKKKSTKTTKNLRTIACKHLQQRNAVSNAGFPLCYCEARDFTMSPYNIVCQVCSLYQENTAGVSHKEMYIADEAEDFIFDPESLELEEEEEEEFDEAEEFEEEDEEEEEEEIEEIPLKKKKQTKKKVTIEEEDEEDEEEDEEEDIEEVTEEEEEDEIKGPIIGKEEEDEENLDYEDETEEALGKKHGTFGAEDEEFDEDEEIEEELDDFEDEEEIEDDSFVGGDEEEEDDLEGNEGSGIDFEAEVINKIKTSGDKEICPFCQKSKVSVLRHLSKCKRAPPEIITALAVYKNKNKKTTKKSKKSTKSI